MVRESLHHSSLALGCCTPFPKTLAQLVMCVRNPPTLALNPLRDARGRVATQSSIGCPGAPLLHPPPPAGPHGLRPPPRQGSAPCGARRPTPAALPARRLRADRGSVDAGGFPTWYAEAPSVSWECRNGDAVTTGVSFKAALISQRHGFLTEITYI